MLADHLQDPTSPLRRWCRDHLPGLDMLTTTLQTASRREPPRIPTPATGADPRLVRAALQTRLGWCLQPAAPQRALRALIAAGRITPEEAAAITTAWPATASASPTTDVAAAVAEFTGRTGRYVAAHTKPGHIGEPGPETGLARLAWTFARVEHTPDALAAVPAESLHSWHQDAPPEVLADLVALVDLARRTTMRSWRFSAGRRTPGQAWGSADPALAGGWATGGLLVGPSLEVLLVDDELDPEKLEPVLWWLLLTAWLAPQQVRVIGVLLARHGQRHGWGVQMAGMQATGSMAQARHTRAEFITLARQLAHDDGVDLAVDELGEPTVDTLPWGHTGGSETGRAETD